jgi:hypothetical protein
MASHDPFGHLQHKLWQKEGSRVKLAVWLPTTKSQESTWPRCVQVSATNHWKALKESYKFASDLILIRGLSKELWIHKVSGIQTRIVSGLLLEGLGTKSHSDVGATEQHREYYMGEGGGFPRIWAVVNLVNPELLVACLSTKGAPKCKLTNLLVGLMQVRMSN